MGKGGGRDPPRPSPTPGDSAVTPGDTAWAQPPPPQHLGGSRGTSGAPGMPGRGPKDIGGGGQAPLGVPWHIWGASGTSGGSQDHPEGTPAHLGALRHIWGGLEGHAPARSLWGRGHIWSAAGHIWMRPQHTWGSPRRARGRLRHIWMAPLSAGGGSPAHLGSPRGAAPSWGHPGGDTPQPGHPAGVPRLRRAGVPCPQATIGSTPSCSHPVPEMSQLTEVHPGNYLFYGERDTPHEPVGTLRGWHGPG